MTYKPADIAAALAELKRDGTTVELVEGETYKLPSGLQQVGEGSTLDGRGAHLIAPSPMRIVSREPGAVLKNFRANGYVTHYNYASKILVENVVLSHSLDGKTILDHGAAGSSATGAFMSWLPLSTTKRLEQLTYRRCMAEDTYHHGFCMNLEGGSEGGEFRDVLYDSCVALRCGKHDRKPRDGASGAVDLRNWACCFNIPDAGDITRMTVRDCIAGSPIQDCFHMDGSWSGHRMNITDVLFERCHGFDAGQRCNAGSVEKFWHGFYTPQARIVDCTSENCRHAGIAIINTESNQVDVRGHVDTGSAYGMILNYAAYGAKVQLTSRSAKVRAFVGQAGNGGGTLDLTVIDFAGNGPACTFGRALRADYIDCPNHDAQQRDKYDKIGYTLDGRAITIRAAEKPTVEVWRTSTLNGAIVYDIGPDTTIPDEKPPVVIPDTPEVPPVVLPPEDLTGLLQIRDMFVWVQDSDGTYVQTTNGQIPKHLQGKFRHGQVYGPEV